MMPPSSSYAASSMPFGAMPGGFDAPPGVMRMRHSVSAIELPQSGGMQGAGNFQQQQSFPMYGLGAPMAPLTDLQHLSSPRASQVLATDSHSITPFLVLPQLLHLPVGLCGHFFLSFVKPVCLWRAQLVMEQVFL